MDIKIRFVFDDNTKNYQRYKAAENSDVIGNIYLPRGIYFEKPPREILVVVVASSGELAAK